MIRIALLLALAAALLSACGDDSDTDSGAAAPAAEPAAFPVTIEHKYGSTTIEEAPKRVVVAGLREQDSLLALGVVPVATTEWYGEHPGAIFPWAEKALGDAPKPEVLSFIDGIQFEKIAALRPDLILGVYSGLTKKDYDTLVQDRADRRAAAGSGRLGLLVAGRDHHRGAAPSGKPKEAEKLRDETQAKLDEVAKEHPEFTGQTAAVATPWQGVYVYGPQDARSRLLTELGFTFPDARVDIGGKDEFGGNLSTEKLDLLDVGALVWFANPGSGEEAPRQRRYTRRP